jgi:hypothetical protein
MVDTKQMNLFDDHGKIPLANIEAAALAGRTNTSDVGVRRTQRARHLYKCLSKSFTADVRDNLDPYLKSISQDGALYFKYLMIELASNPSPEAEARENRQILSRIKLIQHLKMVKHDVKQFNLYMHGQLTKLASYTTKQKEDLDTDLMAAFRVIPCSAYRAKLRTMDKERHAHAWTPKKILAEALTKCNNVCTNEEWPMDLTKTEAPPNPLALPPMEANRQRLAATIASLAKERQRQSTTARTGSPLLQSQERQEPIR